MSLRNDSINSMNKALYSIDPANTSCKENEGMEDEYLSVAEAVISKVEAGFSHKDAIRDEFDFWFLIELESSEVEEIESEFERNMKDS